MSTEAPMPHDWAKFDEYHDDHGVVMIEFRCRLCREWATTTKGSGLDETPCAGTPEG